MSFRQKERFVQVSVRQAAQRLSISPQRVRALAATGRIPARKVGRDWVVDLARLSLHDRENHGPGRPLSARSCWAILDLFDGKQPVGLSRSEHLRARTRAESLAGTAPGALSTRAEVLTPLK
ncbi:MAG: helix-turn-helix domain-containing protein [Actinobacteria bacterium]|nr:helix-turn-helix domain-containing protein [Actinomycetota bacterium]